MSSEQPDQEGYQAGDKVRVRVGANAGMRGVVVSSTNQGVAISLTTGEVIQADTADLTNFSLAARKAWKAMPKRAGRPAKLTPRKKMVSLRLEVDLWEALGRAAEAGLIQSREDAVNGWLRQGLRTLNCESASEQLRPETQLVDKGESDAQNSSQR